MTLYGSKGVVHFMITDDPKIYHFPDPEWTPGKPGVDWQLVAAPKDVKTGAEANVRLLIADLFRAIETDTQSVASFYEARGVLEMLLAVYTSQLEGGRVSFPLKERKHPLGALTR
jgi:predicted dehydrogenase